MEEIRRVHSAVNLALFKKVVSLFGNTLTVPRIFYIRVNLNVKVRSACFCARVAVITEKSVSRNFVALFDFRFLRKVHIRYRGVKAFVKNPVVAVFVDNDKAVAAAAALSRCFAVQSVKSGVKNNSVPESVKRSVFACGNAVYSVMCESPFLDVPLVFVARRGLHIVNRLFKILPLIPP